MSLHHTIAGLVLALLGSACAAQDTWNGVDKRQHLMASTGIGLVFTGLTESNARAWGACTAVGAGKEVLDRAAGGLFSVKDLTADALGCAVGVLAGRTLVTFTRERGAQVTYRTEF